jgi:hypothetical protein
MIRSFIFLQIVVFTTSVGSFEAEIYQDKMPITAGVHPSE